MRKFIIIFSSLILANCSLNSMTLEEYEIYIDDYTKKSKYPDISK